jgi:hypothetical protein
MWVQLQSNQVWRAGWAETGRTDSRHLHDTEQKGMEKWKKSVLLRERVFSI